VEKAEVMVVMGEIPFLLWSGPINTIRSQEFSDTVFQKEAIISEASR
jgi:hypothetical protein